MTQPVATTGDKWGPSLPTPATVDASAQGTPAPRSSGGARPAVPACSPPSASTAYNRPLAEDPIYKAALEQALRSSALGGMAMPRHGQQPAPPPPPPPPARFLAQQPPPPPTQASPAAAAAAAARHLDGLSLGSSADAKKGSKANGGPAGNGKGNAGKPDLAALIPPSAIAPPPPPPPPAKTPNQAQAPAARPPSASPAPAASVPSSAPKGGNNSSRARKETHLVAGAGGGAAAQQQRGPGPAMSPADLQRGLKLGTLLRGRLRINAGDPREGYVTVPGLPSDVMIRAPEAHDHGAGALEGDEVALVLLPMQQWLLNGKPAGGKGPAEPWTDACAAGGSEGVKAEIRKLLEARQGLRATARAAAVLVPGPRREQVVGVLQAAPGTASGEPLLYLLPMDPRMPRCQVSASSVKGLPEELMHEAASENVESRTLMSARVVDWPPGSPCPVVELRCSLGQSGELESETAAILEMEGVRCIDFSDEVLECLPSTPWSVKAEDEAGRADFRRHRIFSIDPPTAKDLDDALSVDVLPGGNLRVGVHIADVASFIPPFSALDVEAGMRATSTYLVQRVIPMLPRLLCEELCSLNPGVERFAFSVVWELDSRGRILTQWAGRSLICSCAKLTYPMVQHMIEGDFDAATHAPATALHGGFTWEQVRADCLALNTLARTLRASRFDNGALRLDNMKLSFQLDKDGNPVSCGQYVQREANQLVEEFMLLANMSVARVIAESFPEQAMLRRHVAPDMRKMKELQAIAEEHGIPIDATSAASLQSSLATFRASCTDPCLVEAVTMLATRPMQLAMYFCTGEIPDPAGWRHYALAVQYYTHFTSPIRRYPDVVVHRLLAAALDARREAQQEAARKLQLPVAVAAPPPQDPQLLPAKLCGKVAEHCNEKRLSARKAQDASLRLYLCCLLRRRPVVTTGIVLSLGGDKYFSVYCPEYGVDCRLFSHLMGVPCRADWDEGAHTLILDHGEPKQQQQREREQQQSRGKAALPPSSTAPGFGLDGASSGSLDPCSSDFCFSEWIEHLANPAEGAKARHSGLDNPQGLQPVMLPLKLRSLCKLPVVLYSPLRPGKISEVVARIYLQAPRSQQAGVAREAPGAEAAAGSAAADGSLHPGFQIPWDSTLND